MKQMAWVVTVAASAAAVAACGDNGATAADAAIDAPTMCAPKTAPLAPGMHTIYLNFDGVTLMRGTDNASMNMSDLIPDTITVPAYVATGDASVRQGRIDLIVDYVQRALAPYSVDVVTTRPAAAPYMMMVIGGKPEDFGFPANILSIAGQKCHVSYNAVALEFEPSSSFAAINYASTILSDLSVMVGMGLTTRHNDCSNRVGDSIDPGVLCSFDAMAPFADTNNCGMTGTQDEPKILMDVFGCRD